MFEQRPTFLARKNPGTGWGIDILWADGETEVIKGFITEHDAVKWIAEYSKAWQRITDDKPSENALAIPNQAGQVEPDRDLTNEANTGPRFSAGYRETKPASTGEPIENVGLKLGDIKSNADVLF